MTVTLTDEGTGRLAYDITGVASVVAGAQGAIANPFGCSVHIVKAYLLVKTQSTAAGQLSIGIAANATTLSNDIWTATAMNGQTEGSVYNCFADTTAAVTVFLYQVLAFAWSKYGLEAAAVVELSFASLSDTIQRVA